MLHRWNRAKPHKCILCGITQTRCNRIGVCQVRDEVEVETEASDEGVELERVEDVLHGFKGEIEGMMRKFDFADVGLTLVFVHAKLAGYVAWPWYVVVSPLIIAPVVEGVVDSAISIGESAKGWLQLWRIKREWERKAREHGAEWAEEMRKWDKAHPSSIARGR